MKLKQKAALEGDFLVRCGNLSNLEEGCRSALFGTTISRHSGHHLLIGGIAEEGWLDHQ
jgi:hypothetical protein